MGFFDGVKGKLGFSDDSDWQDGQNQYSDDGYYDDSYNDEGGYYDDESAEYDDYPQDGGNPLSFDEYNPNSFQNVTINTDRELKVASYDDITDYSSTRSYRSSSPRSSYSSSFTDSSSYSRPSSYSSYGSSSSSYSSSSSDPYSQFDSDIKQISMDPSSRIEIVRPSIYSDVEKIASSFKAGKTVAIVFNSTPADLAKRVLDFSFGVASALNGTVEKEGIKTFIISKGMRDLSEDERKYLRDQGAIQ